MPTVARPHDTDEKDREIKRLKDDDLFPLECGDLIKYLGTETIKNPHFKATQVDICRYVLELSDEDTPTKANIGQVKALMKLARAELIKAYERPGSAINAFRIDLPKGNRSAGITLRFKRRRRKRAAAIEAPGRVAQSAVKLWQRMIGSLEVETIFLIYDTPEVGLPDRATDQRGWWSGAGEVAAAQQLGELLFHVRGSRKLRVRRWRDMEHDDLVDPGACLVILGSSLNNPWLKRLRERERWVDQQRFHFEAPTSEGSRGCICKGPLCEKDARDRLLFEHKEDGPAEHDYALVSFFRDVTYRQSLIALQGVTTGGTLAATLFLCREDYMQSLKDFLLRNNNYDIEQNLRSFEVLLKLHLNDGRPTDISIVDAEIYKA